LHSRVPAFWRDKRREYLRCEACGLVFVPPRFFLSVEEEKKRYDLHRNSPRDEGYRAFLERLFAPMNSLLAPKSEGLDFGSGPEPVLSRMFEDAGHSMTRFDRFYAPAPAALERQYDFIVACEVAEHLSEPGAELERLWTRLRPGGRLGIMTQLLLVPDAFPAWHYKNDLTHICFYAPATFAWLAKQWSAQLTFQDRDVAVFHKRSI
jgi:SAM-dependent methyltransferase